MLSVKETKSALSARHSRMLAVVSDAYTPSPLPRAGWFCVSQPCSRELGAALISEANDVVDDEFRRAVGELTARTQHLASNSCKNDQVGKRVQVKVFDLVSKTVHDVPLRIERGAGILDAGGALGGLVRCYEAMCARSSSPISSQ